VFAETTPVDQLKEFIGSIKAKSFEREMGVALAFDYLNWATFGVAGNQEIKKDERLHIVVLSNEDDVDTPLTTTWFGPRGGQFYMYYESQTTVRFSAVHDRSTAFLASEFCLADAFKGRENEIKQLANVNPETHICKYSDRATEQFSPVGLSGYTQCKTYYSKCPRVIDGFADFYEFPSPQIGCEVMTTRTSVQSYMVASVPGWLEKWIVKKEDGSFDCQYIDVSCKLAAVFKHELKFGAADGKNRLEEIRTKPCDVGFSRSMYDSPQQVFAAKDYQLASRVTYPDSISPRVTPGRRLTFIESFSDHVTLEEAARRIAAKYPNMDVSGMEIVEESSKSIGYKPTPENFMSLQDKIVPGRDVTWHAIVNLSGQRCAGDGEESGTVSKGADYIRLAEMTGGVVADICAPKFEDFLEAIGSKVTTELEKSYDLRLVTGEVDFAGWHVKQVRRGSVILKVGQDYFVEGANLRFSPRVLARDCEFVVTIGKR
jgi:hypothetical protein